MIVSATKKLFGVRRTAAEVVKPYRKVVDELAAIAAQSANDVASHAQAILDAQAAMEAAKAETQEASRLANAFAAVFPS